MDFDKSRIPAWAKFVYFDWMEDPIFGSCGLRMICYTRERMELRGGKWVAPVDKQGRMYLMVEHDEGVQSFPPHYWEV